MVESNRFSLETLEFFKVLEHLRHRLRTRMGQEQLLASRPVLDFEFLDKRKQELETGRRILELGYTFPLDGILDIRSILRRVSIPATILEAEELVRTLRCLQATRRLQNAFDRLEVPFEALESYANGLCDFSVLEQALDRTFLPDGSIKDEATPELKQARTQIRKQRAWLQRRLEDLCRNPDIAPLLQDNYFTERQGRYVLPVLSTQKRKLPGLQHGRSDSGTTAFIEPLELVESGNVLTEALDEEQLEIQRILATLSESVREYASQLDATLEVVGGFDLVISMAEYALELDSPVPEFVAEGPLVINAARHPLLLAQLSLKEVVPNNLVLGDKAAGVLITGPNTGGKTVVLKTVGLLCALAQSGLPIPCGAGTRLPIMSHVLADIGDDQSLEQSLSTFSAHIARMRSYLEMVSTAVPAEGRCLVILDELGAGTDPAEGAALGRAVLEALLEQDCWLLVATHLGELKLFGHSDDRLVSGAMRFDTRDLKPTYELLLETVGESHGLQIAAQLGLDATVVARARELVSGHADRAVSLLYQLSEAHRQAEDSRLAAEALETEVHEKRDQLVRRLEDTARREQQILKEAKATAESRIKTARHRAEGLEEKLRKQEERFQQGLSARERELADREKKIAWLERELEDRLERLVSWTRKYPNLAPEWLKPAEQAHAEMQQNRQPEWQRLLGEINAEEDRLKTEFADSGQSPGVDQNLRPDWTDLKVGAVIRVDNLDQAVRITALDARKRRVSIELGNLISEIPFKRVLQLVKGADTQTSAQETEVKVSTGFRAPHVKGELNVIGQRLEEMVPNLDKYLEDAWLAGWERVRIIHGLGAGILREGVVRHLQDHPLVRSFSRAEAAEGGAGATIAELDRS